MTEREQFENFELNSMQEVWVIDMTACESR